MATPTSTRTQQLTRPSGLGAMGWALPVVFLLPALVMSVLAARELAKATHSPLWIGVEVC